MIKKLAKCVREYKASSILTLIFIVGEALIETLIPFITAQLINHINDGADITEILKTGLILVGMAVASLTCGGFAVRRYDGLLDLPVAQLRREAAGISG